MFFPFFENLKNIAQYNSAYYAAIASVERAELVLRYREPWFQWNGWFVSLGPIADSPPSDFNSDFGMVNDDGNGMWWTINSRATRVPSIWWWNVEVMLADVDSLDYNMLDYSHTEIVNLGVDDTKDPNEFYTTGSNIKNFSWERIIGFFRLPPKVFEWFDDWNPDNSLLCGDTSYSACDPNGDGLYNDAIVNRTLKGDYSWETFSITPTFSVDYNGNPAIVWSFDTFIRESSFDDQIATFSTDLSDFSPIESMFWYPQTKHNVMWQYAGNVEGRPFRDILWWLTWLNLRFSLMDLLRSRNHNVYPFLEYKLEFSDEISDRFYNIQWVWQVWDYDVHINISKPTSNESTAGQFTIIF